jgi:hypothetical protein
MVIDQTALLAPLLWFLFGALVCSALAIALKVDPEFVEIHIDERILMAITAVVLAVGIGLALFLPWAVAVTPQPALP